MLCCSQSYSYGDSYSDKPYEIAEAQLFLTYKNGHFMWFDLPFARREGPSVPHLCRPDGRTTSFGCVPVTQAAGTGKAQDGRRHRTRPPRPAPPLLRSLCGAPCPCLEGSGKGYSDDVLYIAAHSTGHRVTAPGPARA